MPDPRTITHDELRKQAIFEAVTQVYCHICGGLWPRGREEEHIDCCIAKLPAVPITLADAREQAIECEEETYAECLLCGESWLKGDEEEHLEGCVVRPDA